MNNFRLMAAMGMTLATVAAPTPPPTPTAPKQEQRRDVFSPRWTPSKSKKRPDRPANYASLTPKQKAKYGKKRR